MPVNFLTKYFLKCLVFVMFIFSLQIYAANIEDNSFVNGRYTGQLEQKYGPIIPGELKKPYGIQYPTTPGDGVPFYIGGHQGFRMDVDVTKGKLIIHSNGGMGWFDMSTSIKVDSVDNTKKIVKLVSGIIPNDGHSPYWFSMQVQLQIPFIIKADGTKDVNRDLIYQGTSTMITFDCGACGTSCIKRLEPKVQFEVLEKCYDWGTATAPDYKCGFSY